MSATKRAVAAMIAVGALSAGAGHANQLPYLGEIRTFATPECPPAWLPTDGRLVDIAHYGLLHALIGNVYGGDDRHTFALPRLAPIKAGDRQEIRCIAMYGVYHRF